MARRSGTLILSDGDIASLICVMHASEEMLSSADGSSSADLLVIVPTHANMPQRSAAISRQAACHSTEVADSLPPGLNDTDVLLAAGRLASDKDIARVLWPVHAGVAGDTESIDLGRAAAIANTAALVERLLDVEDGNAPAIHVPYVDLCDRQIADLAIDLGMVPGDVWWAAGTGDEQLLAAERWSSAFEACGAPLRLPRTANTGSRRG